MYVDFNMLSDEGIMYLIEENSAKTQRLREENRILREELVRRANGKKESKTKNY